MSGQGTVNDIRGGMESYEWEGRYVDIGYHYEPIYAFYILQLSLAVGLVCWACRVPHWIVKQFDDHQSRPT